MPVAVVLDRWVRTWETEACLGTQMPAEIRIVFLNKHRQFDSEIPSKSRRMIPRRREHCGPASFGPVTYPVPLHFVLALQL